MVVSENYPYVCAGYSGDIHVAGAWAKQLDELGADARVIYNLADHLYYIHVKEDFDLDNLVVPYGVQQRSE